MTDKNLTKALDDFIIMRNNNIDLINSIDISKIMLIPKGFANNIFWQAGHIVTVQVSLLYKRTNQPLPIDIKYFDYFGKGTSPENFDDDIPSFDELKKQLEKLKEYTSSNYPKLSNELYEEEITVSTGHKLKTFGEALEFLPIHEAVHYGNMVMMRKFL